MIQESTGLKYEPASEPLHISVKRVGGPGFQLKQLRIFKLPLGGNNLVRGEAARLGLAESRDGRQLLVALCARVFRFLLRFPGSEFVFLFVG